MRAILLMNAPQPKIIGVGNALVDLTYYIRNLTHLPIVLQADSACLLNASQWQTLNAYLPAPSNVSPGGSSGNTIAGIASLNGTTGFIGVVGDDHNGKLLRNNLQALSIQSYLANSTSAHLTTGNCMVFIGKDGTRTMAAFLGVAGELSKEHIVKEPICKADVLFLEGYLFDKPTAQEAFYYACEIAHQHQTKTVFSLSDISCVRKHKHEIIAFLDKVDILFANKTEICTLTATKTPEEAMSVLSDHKIWQACITDGADGAYTISDQTIKHSKAFTPTNVLDLNGAGDGFAAGFLYAYLYSKSGRTDFHACAKLGHAYAQKVAETSGPRPSAEAIKDILTYDIS